MGLGERIQKFREEHLKVSKKELSQMLGVSQSAVNQWEKGVNLPSQKRLIQLSRVFGVSYEWLISGATPEVEKDGIEIPFYEEIHCSADSGYFNGESEALLISEHLIPIPPGKLYRSTIALRVYGDSMEPGISDNGIVFVDTSDTSIVDGRIYVYKQEDVLRVKRLEYSVSGLIIKSLNSAYRDERVTYQEMDHFCIIGRVLFSINQF